MTAHDPRDLRTRLDKLLTRERTALLSGDLHAIGDLAQEKERLTADLATLGPDGLAHLRDLHDMARRNQALLDGALQGIRLATARLAAYRRLRGEMDTYDPQGRKTTIPGILKHRLERRA